MAIRNDITIRWDLSPRLIIIDASSNEIVMQDLIDTLRTLEAKSDGIDEDYILNASGKEDLGGGTTVGLTVELQNAYIYFEERSWKVNEGTCTQTNIEGTNLYDSSASFLSDNLEIGYIIHDHTTGNMATILSVISDNQIYSLPLSGDSSLGWTTGDSYHIHQNELCATSGGNLVAVDASGNSMYPILQSPNVQSTLTSSSSATSSNLEAIQYSSYQNAVWFDSCTNTIGVEYPSGTREFPVNNLVNAVTIANSKGFDTIQFLRDAIINTGININGFCVQGRSHVATNIFLEDSALCEDVRIYECNIEGTLDGGVMIEHCMVGDINYVNGHIHDSGLYGNIILDGNEDAILADCHTIDMNSYPSVDMGGSGQNLIITNYSGIMTITNSTDASNYCGVGMDAGKLYLDSTLTGGTFIISGIGILQNDSSGAIIDSTELIDPRDINNIPNETVNKMIPIIYGK